MKLAATDFAALMLTVHDEPETVSHPVHPLKNDPGCEVAVSVTTVPVAYVAEHPAPQLIPPGLELTVPRPIPVLVTVSVKLNAVNVGTTDLDAFSVRLHVSLDAESHPLQLSNLDPATGDAVRVIDVPVP